MNNNITKINTQKNCTKKSNFIYFNSNAVALRHRGRAVKAIDSKSIGVTRVGSSPAGVEVFGFHIQGM